MRTVTVRRGGVRVAALFEVLPAEGLIVIAVGFVGRRVVRPEKYGH